LNEHLDAEDIAELVEDLKRQVDPKSGKSLIDAIYTNEVYGEGPFTLPEPHLLLLPNEGITFRMDLGSKWCWNETSQVRGTHQKEGVLYAYGGGIKKGFKAPNAEIYDLVPTVLRSLGLPLSNTFDGRVLDELFVQSSSVESTPIAAENGFARRKLAKLLEM